MIRTLLLLGLSALTLKGEETIFRSGLVARSPERPRRAAFHIDAVEKAIVAGEWAPPLADQPVIGGTSNQIWRAAVASPEGVFTNRELQGGGYVYCPIVSENDEVRVLSAAGQEVVYVNGEPRPGDPYSNGILELPVKLRRGTNDFLFRVGRGRLKAKLSAPARAVALYLTDATTPDIVQGERGRQWAAVIIVNCTTNALKGLSLAAEAGGRGVVRNSLPGVPPLRVRKVGFQFQPQWSDVTNRLELKLTLMSAGRKTLDSGSLWLTLRKEGEHYNQTFVSEIDGSVQYFAVAPARPLSANTPARALFLSLHGAGVEASGQAAAYQ